MTAERQIPMVLVAVSLAAIALYVATEATVDLVRQDAPDRSLLGVAIVALSIVVMPSLAASWLVVRLSSSSARKT